MRQFTALFLLALTAIALSACGGNSASLDDLPPVKVLTMTAESGGSVVGANLVIKKLDGTKVYDDRPIAGEEPGTYLVTLTKASIDDGFTVLVRHGQADLHRFRRPGAKKRLEPLEPFNGKLLAIYAGPGEANDANVTLLTTLVARLARQRADTGAMLLDSRNAVIQALTEDGYLDRAKHWNNPDPAGMRVDAIVARIEQFGFDRAMDTITRLLKHDNPAALAYFPHAFGGVVASRFPSADVGNNGFTVFPGATIATGPALVRTTPAVTGDVSFELKTGPDGMAMDPDTGALTFTVPENSAGEAYTFTYVVATGLGQRRVTGAVEVLDPMVIAQETVNGEERVTDRFGRYLVHVPQGTSTARITIRRGRNADGDRVIQIATMDPLASGHSIDISLPEQGIVNSAEGANAQQEAGGGLCGGFTAHQWVTMSAWYYDHLTFAPENMVPGSNRLHPTALEIDADLWNNGFGQSLTAVQQDLAVLCGSISREQAQPGGTSVIPVLFVHGYTPGDDGLGADPTSGLFADSPVNAAFGVFPRKLDGKAVSGGTIRAFVFRWSTEARFQDAAYALRQAISMIKRETGHDVNIVAHSFGGVLVRTYLQGLVAGSPDAARPPHPVASVVSLGAPYGGLYADATNGFPAGIADGAFARPGRDGCVQIICYQMGNDVVGAHADGTASGLVSALYAGTTAGAIVEAINDPDNRITPDGLDYLSLIGLGFQPDGPKRFARGDGVITLATQRFTFTNGEPPTTLLQTTSVLGATVTERILGFPETFPQEVSVAELPGNEIKTAKYFFCGFGHTRLQADYPGLPEAYISPGKLPACSESLLGGSNAPPRQVRIEWTREVIQKADPSGTAAVPATAQLELQVQGVNDLSKVNLAVQTATHPDVLRSVSVNSDRLTLTVDFYANTEYQLFVSAPGHATQPLVFNTGSAASGQSLGSIFLPSSDVQGYAALSGVIKNASNGRTLGDATWKVTRDGVVYASGSAADSSGEYSAPRLPRGRYLLHAEADGFEPETVRINLRQGSNTRDISLTPESGSTP